MDLGQGTKALFTAYRRIVPFLDQDRALTPDIEVSHEFLKAHSADEITRAVKSDRHNFSVHTVAISKPIPERMKPAKQNVGRRSMFNSIDVA